MEIIGFILLGFCFLFFLTSIFVIIRLLIKSKDFSLIILILLCLAALFLVSMLMLNLAPLCGALHMLL